MLQIQLSRAAVEPPFILKPAESPTRSPKFDEHFNISNYHFFRSTEIKVIDIRTGPKKKVNKGRRLITDGDNKTATSTESKDISSGTSTSSEPKTIEIGEKAGSTNTSNVTPKNTTTQEAPKTTESEKSTES